ncbi:spondin-1 precursor [Silurus meridionalis]|nr:spondin-1 precursor [Silurus meridionalis]
MVRAMAEAAARAYLLVLSLSVGFLCVALAFTEEEPGDRAPKSDGYCSWITRAHGARKELYSEFRLRVEGEPESYQPGSTYRVTLYTTSPAYFRGFTLIALKEGRNGDKEEDYAGNFQIIDEEDTQFMTNCPPALTESTPRRRTKIQVLWMAPSSGSGCILLNMETEMRSGECGDGEQRDGEWGNGQQGDGKWRNKEQSDGEQGDGKWGDGEQSNYEVGDGEQSDGEWSNGKGLMENRGMQNGVIENRIIERGASIIQRKIISFQDEGSLTKRLCEREPLYGEATEKPLLDCCACGTAKYRVTFYGNWSEKLHPKDYPKLQIGHFYSPPDVLRTFKCRDPSIINSVNFSSGLSYRSSSVGSDHTDQPSLLTCINDPRPPRPCHRFTTVPSLEHF